MGLDLSFSPITDPEVGLGKQNLVMCEGAVLINDELVAGPPPPNEPFHEASSVEAATAIKHNSLESLASDALAMIDQVVKHSSITKITAIANTTCEYLFEQSYIFKY